MKCLSVIFSHLNFNYSRGVSEGDGKGKKRAPEARENPGERRPVDFLVHACCKMFPPCVLSARNDRSLGFL